jgi:GLPGLI family protein
MKFPKRLIMFGTWLAFISFASNAQLPERAQVVVHYKFTHVRDTNNRAHPYTENMALYIGKSASVYRSYEPILEDARYKKEFEEQMAKSPNGYVTVNHYYTGSSTEYLLFPNEQKFFIKDNLFANNYLIEELIPAVKWTISSETGNIGDLHCQKATCYFKGRNYIVWFCPDLPVRSGPWKLNGLPGVIVDAHDTKNEVVFKFDEIEKMITSKPKSNLLANGKKPLPPLGMENLNIDLDLIELPPNVIKATQKQFDKLSLAMHKDPNAIAQSSAGNGNMNGGGPKMDAKAVRGAALIINNPLELPEKK